MNSDMDGRTQLDWPQLADDRSADIRFRTGPGGEMPPEWAAYMLNLWWTARDGKLTFRSAVQQATVHFMVGDQP